MAVKKTKSLSHGIYILIGSVAEGKEEEEKNKKTKYIIRKIPLQCRSLKQDKKNE